VLQRVVVHCSASQCAAVCCSVLQWIAVCCSVLQCAAVCCSVLQCVTMDCSALQRANLKSDNFVVRTFEFKVQLIEFRLQFYLHIIGSAFKSLELILQRQYFVTFCFFQEHQLVLNHILYLGGEGGVGERERETKDDEETKNEWKRMRGRRE